MLTSLIVVIILQYIQISNSYAVHLKLIRCYRSIISKINKKQQTKNTTQIRATSFG